MKIAFYFVREYLESKGFVFTHVWTPYRVFEKPGLLPIMVLVEDKMVDNEDFEKAKQAAEGSDKAGAD